MCTFPIWTLVYYVHCLCTINVTFAIVECIFAGAITLGNVVHLRHTVCYSCDTAFASRLGVALDHYLQPVCRDPLSDNYGPLSSTVPTRERVEEFSLPNDSIFSHDCQTPTVVT